MTTTEPAAGVLLVEGLSERQRALLEASARTLELRAGETLFRLGDDADSVFVVRSGIVELTLQVPVGGVVRRIVVEEASSGETIGWSALVPPHKYTLDASAAVDSALHAWTRVELLNLCRADPVAGNDVLLNLLTTVGRRLHVLYAMWARELQRNLARDYPPSAGAAGGETPARDLTVRKT
jgi:CRP/FNR family transcriptional regulator, cyclic AMP receptor protein